MRILIQIILWAAAVAAGPLEDARSFNPRPESETRCHRPYADYRHAFESYREDAAALKASIIISQGGPISPSTLERLDPFSPDTDIEHVVSRQEAWASGLCSEPTIRRYVTDLYNLTLATFEVNRAKSNLDYAEWQPDHNRCWTAAVHVRMKRVYQLHVDKDEQDALVNQLSLCDSFALRLES